MRPSLIVVSARPRLVSDRRRGPGRGALCLLLAAATGCGDPGSTPDPGSLSTGSASSGKSDDDTSTGGSSGAPGETTGSEPGAPQDSSTSDGDPPGPGSSDGAESSTAEPPNDADPLLGGLSEDERFDMFYFQEQDGRVVIEAEHFVRQEYGNEHYRGARWWMVNTDAFRPKDHPLFAERCELARDELMNMEMEVGGGFQIGDIVSPEHGNWTTYWTDEEAMMHSAEGMQLQHGANWVFEQFGCDADDNHSGSASEGSYVELTPDVLYGNYNAIPHAASHWPSGQSSPRVYYRVNFATTGSFRVHIRGWRTEADSGSVHAGIDDSWDNNISFTANETWSWRSSDAIAVDTPGEHWIALGGREDGFEVDKIVVQIGNCGDCNGPGPAESPVVE